MNSLTSSVFVFTETESLESFLMLLFTGEFIETEKDTSVLELHHLSFMILQLYYQFLFEQQLSHLLFSAKLWILLLLLISGAGEFVVPSLM